MSIVKHSIEASKTKIFDELVLDFLASEEKTKAFYKYEASIQSFDKIIEEKSKEKISRNVLSDVLLAQYKKSGVSLNAKVQANIELLRNSNTFTVCTGHQPNLLLGPLYTIYKILSTLQLAQKLNQLNSKHRIVPVYFLSTEDHDFEELSQANVFGKEIQWKTSEEGLDGNQSLGKLNSDSLKAVIDEVGLILNKEGEQGKLFQLIQESYSKTKTFADATRALLNGLFEEYGLIVLDGNDDLLKQEFKEILKRDFKEEISFKEVESTNLKLKDLGYKTQVHPRNINCFYLDGKNRRRIEKVGDSYKVLNTDISFTELECMQELEQHPERFSPNVILRPLYQEKILPNLCYIGGPAEVGYWLQLKSTFEKHGINYPMILPRNSVLFIDQNHSRKMNKLGLNPLDLFEDIEQIVKNYLAPLLVKSNGNEAAIQNIMKEFDSLEARFLSIDSTLKASVEAERHKVLKSLEALDAKALKAIKRQEEDGVKRIRILHSNLFPKGVPQERKDNFINFYSVYGKEFFEILLKAFDPFEFKVLILEDRASEK